MWANNYYVGQSRHKKKLGEVLGEDLVRTNSVNSHVQAVHHLQQNFGIQLEAALGKPHSRGPFDDFGTVDTGNVFNTYPILSKILQYDHI